MLSKSYLIPGAILAFGLLTATPAQASYMSKCNTLISAWQSCTETGKACKTEFKNIEEECRCHAYKQGEWKLVMAAVGKDGVCAPGWPDEPVPDPSPPPRDHDKSDPKKTDKDARHKKDETRQ